MFTWLPFGDVGYRVNLLSACGDPRIEPALAEAAASDDDPLVRRDAHQRLMLRTTGTEVG